MTDYKRIAEELNAALSEILSSVYEKNPDGNGSVTCEADTFLNGMMNVARVSAWAKGLHESHLDMAADRDRAIACVNALAGIADPEAAVKAAREALERARAFLPTDPGDDVKDGPCCHKQQEDGLWIYVGCTCGNYDDAGYAATWAAEKNAHLRAKPAIEAVEAALAILGAPKP